MPLVRVEIIKGHTEEYKKMYMQTVHEALVETLGIPDDDRFQRLVEIDSNMFETNETKTDKFGIIELTLFPGRSADIKQNVIRRMTEMLGTRLKIAPQDIFMIIHEPPLENWGMGGQQASEFK